MNSMFFNDRGGWFSEVGLASEHGALSTSVKISYKFLGNINHIFDGRNF